MELRVAVVGSEAAWRLDVALQRGTGGGGVEPRRLSGLRGRRVRTGRVLAPAALRGGACAALSADQPARKRVLRGTRGAAEDAGDSPAQSVDRSGLQRGCERGAAGEIGGIDHGAESEPAVQ